MKKKTKTHVALYGNIKLQRGECFRCKDTALIVDGKYQCCNRKAKEKPERFKRITEPQYNRKRPTRQQQEKILREQEDCCFWCFRRFGQYEKRYSKIVKITCQWDHVTPYNWSAENNINNFVASCRWCNEWKSNLIFNSIEEVRVFLATKWDSATSTLEEEKEVNQYYKESTAPEETVAN